MTDKLKRFKGFKLPESEIAVLKELKGIIDKFAIGKTDRTVSVRDNHVILINLSGCNLTQVPDFSDLKFLQKINLKNNKITKIPDFFGDLK